MTLQNLKRLFDIFDTLSQELKKIRPDKIIHCLAVGDLCENLALNIDKHYPEFGLNPEFCKAIGYLHDIGYIESNEDHELASVQILEKNFLENNYYDFLKSNIHWYVMHGHLYEKYNDKKYLPKGLEGIILTVADLMTDNDGTYYPGISIRVEKVGKYLKDLSKKTEIDYFGSFNKAVIRFYTYEDLIEHLINIEYIRNGDIIPYNAMKYKNVRL